MKEKNKIKYHFCDGSTKLLGPISLVTDDRSFNKIIENRQKLLAEVIGIMINPKLDCDNGYAVSRFIRVVMRYVVSLRSEIHDKDEGARIPLYKFV